MRQHHQCHSHLFLFLLLLMLGPAVTAVEPILCDNHPNLEALLRESDNDDVGYTMPSAHPGVQDLFKTVLPNGHPDVDDLLARGEQYGDQHPNVSAYVIRDSGRCYTAPQRGTCGAYVTPRHPKITTAINSPNSTYPSDHPSVQNILFAYLPSWHPNVDDLMRSGTPLPAGHPDMEIFACYTYAPPPESTCLSLISQNHPPIDSSFGSSLPQNHPKVRAALSSVIPAGHPDVDDLLRRGVPLPAGHPSVAAYACSPTTTAGMLVALVAIGFLVLAATARCIFTHVGKIKRCRENRMIKRHALSTAGINSDMSEPFLSTFDDDDGFEVAAREYIKSEYIVYAETPDQKSMASLVSNWGKTDSYESGNLLPKSYPDSSNSDLTTGQNEQKTGLQRRIRSNSTKKLDFRKVDVKVGMAENRHHIGKRWADDIVPSDDFKKHASVSISADSDLPPPPKRCRRKWSAATKHALHRDPLYDYNNIYDNAPLPDQGLVLARKSTVGTEQEARHTFVNKYEAYSSSTWARCIFFLCHARIPKTDFSSAEFLIMLLYFVLNAACLLLATDTNYGNRFTQHQTCFFSGPFFRNFICNVLVRHCC
jgi:hypothetical protein